MKGPPTSNFRLATLTIWFIWDVYCALQKQKSVTDDIGMMQLGFAMNVVFAMVVCENMVTSFDV